MSDLAISVEHLSKRYRLGVRERRPDTLLGTLGAWLRSPAQNLRRLRSLSRFETLEAEDILWALKDVSFEVRHGEVVGLIGRNGAGKSTLLKILSQITEPSAGRVVLHGRVASLLEVGTGFHPELTGRENVYLNGTVLGMSKREVDRKFEEIVEFSGVERFIDTPVKRYSSGMKVRLAFAVAAHLEPEILLVDEVLAVGDAEFQKKCLGKMEDVAHGGRTVLFVSHDMHAIGSLCPRAILLESGAIAADGAAHQIVARYLAATARTMQGHSLESAHRSRRTGDLRFTSLLFHDSLLGDGDRIRCNQPFRARIGYVTASGQPPRRVSVSLAFRDGMGKLLGTAATHFNGDDFPEIPPSGVIDCAFEKLPFAPGRYVVQLWCSISGTTSDKIEEALAVDVVAVGDGQGARLPEPGRHGSVILEDYTWTVQQTEPARPGKLREAHVFTA